MNELSNNMMHQHKLFIVPLSIDILDVLNDITSCYENNLSNIYNPLIVVFDVNTLKITHSLHIIDRQGENKLEWMNKIKNV
jgi:hypothetical protein